MNGEAIAEGAAWSPAELVLATSARLPLVKGAICAFKTRVVKLNKLIWPAAEQPGAPDTTANVIDMMRPAPRWVDLLLDSAVRAGTQAALMLVKSWYPG